MELYKDNSLDYRLFCLKVYSNYDVYTKSKIMDYFESRGFWNHIVIPKLKQDFY